MSEQLHSQPAPARQLRGYAEAALMVAAATIVGLGVAPRWGDAAVDLLYLPPVLAAAILAERGPALFAAASSALAYNYFFVAPRHSFRIDNPSDVVTVAILFGTALVTSQLAASVRRQARIAHAHAARNATIAGLARRLIGCTGTGQIALVGVSELRRVFDCNVIFLTRQPGPKPIAAAPETVALTPGDVAIAATVFESGGATGRGLDRALPTEWQFHPIKSATGTIGVAALARDDGAPAVARAQLPLLDNLLDQLALASERSRLEDETRELTRTRERDQLRAALLSSIGEDLRPPLDTVRQSVDALRRQGDGDAPTLSRIGAEVARLDRYVGNLLELAPATDQPPVRAGDVRIDLFHRSVRRGESEIHLAPKEYAVLAELAKHPGRVLSHAHLLRTAWGPAHETQIDYLRVAIRGLRQKLEQDPASPALILNEPAVGYRLRPDDAAG